VASIIAGRGYFEVHSRFIMNAMPGEFDLEIENERAIVAEVQRIGVDALLALVPFLTDSEAEVRASVAEALACYASRADEFEPMLKRALSVERDEETRERIQESLERIRKYSSS
jgi:hypothetical protein